MNKPNNKRSSKVLIGGALVIILALVALFLSTRSKPKKTAGKAKVTTPDIVADTYTPPPPRIRQYKNPAEPPIIDEVILSKTEMCAGETFLVTIKAHSVDPEDDIHLHGVVAGKPGMVVPVVARRNRNPKNGGHMAMVFGREGKRAVAPLPPYTIKDCVAERTLQIGYRRRANTNSEFELSATVMNLKAKEPFVVESYAWDFGDGTTETVKTSTVLHSFGQRKQQTLYSNILLRVTAKSTNGETLVGHRSLQMRNPAFANLVNAGIVTLVVELTPRFPVLEDGVVTQGIRLWHHQAKPLEVKLLRTRRNSSVEGSEPIIAATSIVGTLGTRTIPPTGISFDVVLDGNAEPDLRSIDFLLDGVSAEGIPVKSVFSVMKPSPKPTPENHNPVTDDLLKRKIIRARKLLGKVYVSDEDIFRLQREGKFDDIKPELGDTQPDLPPVYNADDPAKGGSPKDDPAKGDPPKGAKK